MKFFGNRRGQGMTEYIIIVALIAVAAIAAFKVFGGRVTTSIQGASEALDDKGASNPVPTPSN